MNNKLQNCPWCGHEAESINGYDCLWWSVSCSGSGCKAYLEVYDPLWKLDPKELAEKQWNALTKNDPMPVST